MKNFTLTFCGLLLSGALFAQTYSTGPMPFSTDPGLEYGAQIDVNSASNIVTLTLVGPSDRYLGVGFGVPTMINLGDCVIYTGVAGTGLNVLSDRRFNNNTSTPSVDTAQDWNVISNSISGTVRTLVATRARVSTGDYEFPATAGALQLNWSRGDSNGFALQYHGGARGGYAANLTLGNNEFETKSFKIYPNPAKGFFTIEMPENIVNGELKMYDTLGRVVKNQKISELNTQIALTDLQTGTYLVTIRTEAGNSTKQLVVE